MNAEEDALHLTSEQPGGKQGANPDIVDTVGKNVHNSQEKDTDTAPPSFNGTHNTQDDSLSLHSMASGGHVEKPDQKPEAPVPLPAGETESVPPEEQKSDLSLPVNEDVSTEEKELETQKQENGVSIEHPLPDQRTQIESISEEQNNPPSVIQKDAEAATQVDKTGGGKDETKAHTLQDLIHQPSISSGIEEQTEQKSHAAKPVQKKLKRNETTVPGEENPSLLSILPKVKKASKMRTKTGRFKDEDLRSMVLIPGYLSKGMVQSIESGGVANQDAPTLRNMNVRVPEHPLLIFINSKSGGRLGPGLEALLVDLIHPTQVSNAGLLTLPFSLEAFVSPYWSRDQVK
jgi:hypothetical protein